MCVYIYIYTHIHTYIWHDIMWYHMCCCTLIADATVSPHSLNSQTFKLRASNPRTIAYLDLIHNFNVEISQGLGPFFQFVWKLAVWVLAVLICLPPSPAFLPITALQFWELQTSFWAAPVSLSVTALHSSSPVFKNWPCFALPKPEGQGHARHRWLKLVA